MPKPAQAYDRRSQPKFPVNQDHLVTGYRRASQDAITQDARHPSGDDGHGNA
jgi:hypothetical protein